MKNYAFAIALFFLASCHSGNEKKAATPDFGAFSKSFIDSLWKYNPVWASSVGYHRYDAVLPIPDAQTQASYKEFLGNIASQLQAFKYDDLKEVEKTDYGLIENFITSGTFYQNEFKSYEWDPSEYNIGGAIDVALSSSENNLDTRMKNIQSRLEAAPQYYKAGMENLKKISKEHTQLAVAQNEGLSYFFDQALPDSLKKSTLSAEEKKKFEESLQHAKKAVNEYAGSLKKRLAENKADSSWKDFRIGKDLYLKKFKFDIQSAYSADEMYKKAEAGKAALLKEMYANADTLWVKYLGNIPKERDSLKLIKRVIEKIAIHHCHRDSLLQTIEKQLPELTAFINQKHLIDLDSTKPLKVRKTPEYMAGVAGASINSPGPYEQDAATYYNVTPLTTYSKEKAESYLREYNDYVLRILNIHEAIPGHYTQHIYANRSPSLVKTILGNGAMIEGWACYVETMMIEEGYSRSPEMQLFYCKWKLREASNFILDYNIQVNGWGEKEAVHLLSDEAFQEAAEAKEKYKRATLTQVQLTSYFTGDREIRELRDEMKKKEGDKFSLKNFHEKFLSFGSAPVAVIRELMK